MAIIVLCVGRGQYWGGSTNRINFYSNNMKYFYKTIMTGKERRKDVENSKTLFELFLREDRFELSSYLTYLFNQITNHLPDHMDEEIANQ
ncbi:hypothetical protein [Neobacillus mesonae]|uniref:hypothetical protein n=1 Tax=Neobacillus mesonae TaxID=1193713 RepID=UPI002040EC12|nr:hypothetical protein [Neobacillus mesonae]MCM3568445.1 hypothetical protein [Neobacillus mesonae]